MSNKKRSAKVARQLLGQVWENLGKNLLQPKKFACSYTYGSMVTYAATDVQWYWLIYVHFILGSA